MRSMKYVIFLMLPGLCVSLAGCQSTRESKAVAVQQWNTVRSSVQATLAQRQFEAGEFKQARKSVDMALGLTPGSAPLHLLSARISLAEGQLDAAQRELDEVRRLNPDDAEADYYSGIVYQRWQMPKLALSYYDTASRKAPDREEYVLAQAEMLAMLDEPDNALTLLQEKLSRFESSAAIRDAIGSLLMRRGDYVQAARFFEQAGIYAPQDQIIREHLALSLYFSRQYRKAAGIFGPLLADNRYQTRVDFQLAMGECLMHMDRPREALGYLQTAAQLDGHQPAVWMDLARVMLELNRPEDARIALRRAVKLAPDQSQAYLLLGYIALRNNQLDEAMEAFQAAYRADPKDSTGMCMVGQVLEAKGEPEQARRWYTAALKVSPNDELAQRMLASLR